MPVPARGQVGSPAQQTVTRACMLASSQAHRPHDMQLRSTSCSDVVHLHYLLDRHTFHSTAARELVEVTLAACAGEGKRSLLDRDSPVLWHEALAALPPLRAPPAGTPALDEAQVCVRVQRF